VGGSGPALGEEAGGDGNGSEGRSEHVHIAIAGTGFAGLGMAIRLKQAGIDDFVLLERARDVGGTWRDNSYPGCQCDVPSHLYSFSFALNPDWSRTYSRQPEIWDYLRRCAHDHGIVPHIRFDHEVRSAEWSEDERRWRIETPSATLTADIVISGVGALSDPSIPEIPGLGDFQGTVFHSAAWNHDHDLDGRRVAAIGTGASAIQFVPRIQPQVDQLFVFQRTPAWILPHTDRPVSRLERRVYRALPFVQRLVRWGIYWGREWLVLGFTGHRGLMKLPALIGRRHLRRQVADPELRARLKPSYQVGCKRILISNDFYPALSEPNVELVTNGVREIRAHSIVTADGAEREVDTIIFGTGFHVTDMPVGERVRGRDGRSLDEVWQGSPEAYLGTTVTGFPNFFMLLGPNTGLGHTSVVFMVEAQIAYVMDAVRAMHARGLQTVDVRPEVQEAFNRDVQGQLRGTVWNAGGCASWYIDANGRNSTLWPDFTWRYRQRTARFDLSHYVAESPRAAPASVPAAA
jgi:cation diffusion facilitator CzcD-associated flavoprotein CzcO